MNEQDKKMVAEKVLHLRSNGSKTLVHQALRALAEAHLRLAPVRSTELSKPRALILGDSIRKHEGYVCQRKRREEKKMERLSKEKYYLEMLNLVAARSTCLRRAVGCIITDEDGHILSTGYNGVPSNFEHCIDVACPGAVDLPGNNSNCMAVHAEQNAIMQCGDLNRARVMYCSCVPCFICAKMIANTKITYITVLEKYADQRGLHILLQAGIVVKVDQTIYGMEDDESTET